MKLMRFYIESHSKLILPLGEVLKSGNNTCEPTADFALNEEYRYASHDK